MPRSHVHCVGLNILGSQNYETHLGSHNSRAKGVLGRRLIMIVYVRSMRFKIQDGFEIDLDRVGLQYQ